MDLVDSLRYSFRRLKNDNNAPDHFSVDISKLNTIFMSFFKKHISIKISSKRIWSQPAVHISQTNTCHILQIRHQHWWVKGKTLTSYKILKMKWNYHGNLRYFLMPWKTTLLKLHALKNNFAEVALNHTFNVV